MATALTTKRLFEKTFKLFDFTGIWLEVFGNPERGGIWIIFGPEKNGKTLFALLLAEYLTFFEYVIFISAEEGTGKEFQDNARRANLNHKNSKLRFFDYIDLETVRIILKKRQAPKIVIFDNITVYNDELKNGSLRKLATDYPNTTLIFLAHEEKKEPYTATAKLCKKLAKIIIRIEGLTAFVSGRCPGGIVTIDEEKAQLYHGSQILKKSKNE